VLLRSVHDSRTSNHRNSWHCRVSDRCRLVRWLKTSWPPVWYGSRSLGGTAAAAVAGFLGRPGPPSRPVTSARCAAPREIEREYSWAVPAPAATSSLGRKIFSGAGRAAGERPRGISVYQGMNVFERDLATPPPATRIHQ